MKWKDKYLLFQMYFLVELSKYGKDLQDVMGLFMSQSNGSPLNSSVFYLGHFTPTRGNVGCKTEWNLITFSRLGDDTGRQTDMVKFNIFYET